MIAFEYFRQKFGLVYHDVPEFVKYVQDQDLGLFKLPDSVEVKNYIYSIPLTVQDYYNHFWIDISYMIDRGITITHYVNTLMENAVKNAVVVVIDDHRCLMINTAVLFSDLGSFLFKYMEQFDCQITGAYYRLNDESIKFSLRSNSNFDVSILAEKFGGGGHKKAAGFEIPFEHFDGRKLICE
jgi:oligoribonuclease NrnB/cAMP/cGMP phosphodiesterase (DHH superfamily)